jgi:hypothetical protein
VDHQLHGMELFCRPLLYVGWSSLIHGGLPSFVCRLVQSEDTKCWESLYFFLF